MGCSAAKDAVGTTRGPPKAVPEAYLTAPTPTAARNELLDYVCDYRGGHKHPPLSDEEWDVGDTTSHSGSSVDSMDVDDEA